MEGRGDGRVGDGSVGYGELLVSGAHREKRSVEESSVNARVHESVREKEKEGWLASNERRISNPTP